MTGHSPNGSTISRNSTIDKLMKRHYFGTDGIRGPVDGDNLHPIRLTALGLAVGSWLQDQGGSSSGALIVRDTRQSGPGIAAALALGLQARNIFLLDGGIAPTPAAPLAAKAAGATLSIVITASHNPATDNGIKFFDANGHKFDDYWEAQIEAKMEAVDAEARALNPQTAIASRPWEVCSAYIAARSQVLPPESLDGMRLVLDCANGATWQTSPAVLRALGAEVITLGTTPDGTNINAGCGSEHPQALAEAVRLQRAQLGIAHDGDGDRLLICDEQGHILDGDRLIFVIARHLQATGRLRGQGIAVTTMSNGGLDKALAQNGLQTHRTDVGDRYVFAAMLARGLNFGGESSGHLIFLDEATCGDGLLTALLFLDALRASGSPASIFANSMPLHALAKKNLPVRTKPALAENPELQNALASLEKELAEQDGRLLLRYSGTENKIRLLTEAPSQKMASQALSQLENLVRRHLPVLPEQA